MHPDARWVAAPCHPSAGEKRLAEHLQFLLTNLSYEHESGREAALDMLTVVLSKFPDQLVSQWAEMVRGWVGGWVAPLDQMAGWHCYIGRTGGFLSVQLVSSA